MMAKKILRSRKFGWILFFAAAAAIVAWNPGADSTPDPGRTEPAPGTATPAPRPSPPPTAWARMGYPTGQEDPPDPRLPGVYQPTAAGNVESALYGSVRTTRQGRKLLPSFHKGIDIAARSRDRRNRPLDTIHAVADGTVAYINRVAGNSSYGLYLVLLHDDPLGEVYTLYSHLASFAPGREKGGRVSAGEVLGVMGTTATYRIPLSRAHLHFEIGLAANSRFGNWAHSRKIRNDHGDYNGWNLMPIDPLEFFRARAENPGRDFAGHLQSIPAAFEAVVRVEKFPDFFRRYPALWAGEPVQKGAIVIACCQYGIPLRGRAAGDDESELLGDDPIRITSVNTEVLGRNGRRVIARKNQRWTLGSNGRNWLSLLTY
ncbi:MAG: M23 family metallopeptidase [Candidatus Erginobacter occultus]|nr:M23 family metallopeptidase [Candidatus Erginobacter occultus]